MTCFTFVSFLTEGHGCVEASDHELRAFANSGVAWLHPLQRGAPLLQDFWRVAHWRVWQAAPRPLHQTGTAQCAPSCCVLSVSTRQPQGSPFFLQVVTFKNHSICLLRPDHLRQLPRELTQESREPDPKTCQHVQHPPSAEILDLDTFLAA